MQYGHTTDFTLVELLRHNGKYHRTDSTQAEKALQSLEAKVSDTSQTGFLSRAADAARIHSSHSTSEAELRLQAIKVGNSAVDESADEVRMFLNEHHTGVKKMQQVLSSIQRDLGILSNGRLKTS